MAKLDLEPRAPGAMTSLMRAFPEAKGAQVLRLARVEAQKVVDERLHRGEVAIGDSPHATIHLDRPAARLFAPEGDGWVLSLPEGARARVALESGPEEIVGPAQRALPRSARGRVTVGATQLLFQLVAAPPIMPPAQLPLAVQGRGSIDWAFLCIAAASFLAHFGFVGAVQADWLDPIVDDEGATAALIVEAQKNRPDVPPEDKPVDKSAPTDDKTPKKTDDGKVAKVDGKFGFVKNLGPSKAKSTSVDLTALSKDLDDLHVGVLGSMGAGPTVSSVMKKGDTAVESAIDEVAKKNNGVDKDNPMLKTGTPVTGPIAGTNGLDKIGDAKSNPNPGNTSTAPGDAVKVPLPAEPSANPIGPNVPKDANSVIAGAKWRFKACYTKELSKNPDAAGTVKVTVETDAGGKVLSSSGAPGGTLSANVAQCVQNAFYALKFADTDTGATFNVPVVLQPAK